MKYYSHFRYQYTEFSNTIDKAISGAKNKTYSVIYSVQRNRHLPIRCIINDKVYMRKHWVKLGFKNPSEFNRNKRYLDLK
jgi:hypothetical protein